MERRKGERFEIELKCRLQINNGMQIAEGTTVNMSRLGALIELPPSCDSEAVPKLSDVLWAEILLPTNREFGPRSLSCKATVVRTSNREGAFTVAIRFQRVEIVAVEPRERVQQSTVVM